MDILSLNWFAIIGAALAMFAVGAVWYTALFGKRWQNLLGFTDEYLNEGNIVAVYLFALLYMIFMATGLAFLMSHHPQSQDWKNGLHFGLWIGFFFVGMGTAINYIFQRQSISLWFIDAGYQILGLGLMGAIIGHFA